ncbi:P-loop NTPase fold protein [Rheinheimera sp. FR7-31]|uniref:KAP family P-loop NTPase fold protein n=1 Tax=Rheinheimera fenheensis TaxID=3152295 RepID=UPI00325F2361
MDDAPKDYFDRKRFAGLLLSHIKMLPTPFAVGLDAPWGYGKTFFVQHVLKPEAEQTKLPLIIYDAFEHEKDGDVFLSLVTTILENTVVLNQGEKTVVETAILDVARATAKFVKAASDVTLNAVSKTLLRQSSEDLAAKFTSDTSAVENFANDIETGVEKFILERTRPGNSYRDIKESFKSSMRKLICTMSDKAKLIVVIDDLDRCTPKHALEILEAVHHLLNTDGIIFLFSYHRQQLERMVEHTYGIGIDATQYLNKFIGLNIQFPTPEKLIHKSGIFKLAKDRFDTYSENLDLNDEVLSDLLKYLHLFSLFSEVSARLTQAFSSLAIAIRRFCYGTSNGLYNRDLAMIIFWALTKPNDLRQLTQTDISAEEVMRIRLALDFDRLRKVQQVPEDIMDSILGGTASHINSQNALKNHINEILTLSR